MHNPEERDELKNQCRFGSNATANTVILAGIQVGWNWTRLSLQRMRFSADLQCMLRLLLDPQIQNEPVVSTLDDSLRKGPSKPNPSEAGAFEAGLPQVN